MHSLLTGICLSLVLAPAFTFAATIVVNPNPPISTPVVTDPITGADMTGLIVRATYATPGAPTVVTATWADTGPTSGVATTGPAFGVSLTGPTEASLAWRYTSQFLSPLVSLEFDGGAAGIYFDRSNPNPGTPGSGPGADIAFSALIPPGTDSLVTVTYSSAVSLGANPAQNDLYAKMRFDFGALQLGGLTPQDFQFTQDTDRASTVPEPASTLLTVAALTLLTRYKRRKSTDSFSLPVS